MIRIILAGIGCSIVIALAIYLGKPEAAPATHVGIEVQDVQPGTAFKTISAVLHVGGKDLTLGAVNVQDSQGNQHSALVTPYRQIAVGTSVQLRQLVIEGTAATILIVSQ